MKIPVTHFLELNDKTACGVAGRRNEYGRIINISFRPNFKDVTCKNCRRILGL